jgi:plasmid maintenance system antidote protein VapI
MESCSVVVNHLGPWTLGQRFESSQGYIMEQQFKPDWKSSPGDTINDILEERRWSLLSFAQKMRMSLDDVNRLIDGSIPITPWVADRLSETIGSTPDFWMERDKQYRR